MKNLVKRQWLFLFALILSVGVVSCSDDDEGPSNQVTVDGDKWSFSKGYVLTQEDVEDDNEETGSKHTIYLTEKGLTINEDDDVLSFEGEGDVTAFVIFSPSSDELEEGTYVIRSDNEEGNVLQFVMATDYSVPDPEEAPEFGKSYMGSYGTVKVSRSGETYTFSFTVVKYTVTEDGDTDEGEGEIKGYFKGKLTRYDYPEPEPVRVGSPRKSLFLF